MIIVCEPLCKKFSHEKVNSGFLIALRAAFPADPIRVYAEITHIQALVEVLNHDGRTIADIEFVPIRFGDAFSFGGAFGYLSMLRTVFSGAVSAGVDRLFFLSFNPVVLVLIKWLTTTGRYAQLRLAFVLHGDFEEIADDIQTSHVPPLPGASLGARLKRWKPSQLPGLVFREVRNRMGSAWRRWQRTLLTGVCSMRKALVWRHSPSIHYIALSPHIVENARRYIDVDWLNISVVPMPIALAEPWPKPHNAHPVFAVFGYGDSAMLHQVLIGLATSRAAQMDYEIRIIGMDDRGTAGFEHVSCPSEGKPLGRAEMEALAKDVDAFLILYTKERYRLSCSGSILEALSYMKPVLHFDNDCVNSFNPPNSPIGIPARDIVEFVGNIVGIVENYPGFLRSADEFRSNIMKRRQEFALEASTERLRQSFTWQGDAVR